MDKYECGPCGYVYDPEAGDPENGIEPGTAFEDLPDDWTCPICGVGRICLKNWIKTTGSCDHHRSLFSSRHVQPVVK